MVNVDTTDVHLRGACDDQRPVPDPGAARRRRRDVDRGRPGRPAAPRPAEAGVHEARPAGLSARNLGGDMSYPHGILDAVTTRPRSTAFVGRDAEIAALREALKR